MAETLPVYFQKTQFTARIGETERQQAADFFQKHFPDGNYPESSRLFLNAIFNLVESLSTNRETEQLPTETNAALAAAEAENRELKEQNNQAKDFLQKIEKSLSDFNTDPKTPRNLFENIDHFISNIKSGNSTDFESEIRKLKAELEAEKGISKTITKIDFNMFNDPRMKGLNDFRLPEHKHPFETIERFKQLADASIIEYEQLKFTLEQQPFQLLEPEEYAFLKKWDEETFMPAMRQLTGRPELVLTGRHKYMMVLDYAQADPIAEIARLIPGLTPAQLDMLQDLQFPRASIVQQVLHDIDEPKTETDDTTNVVEQPKTETEAKVIAIKSADGRTTDPANPATDSPNENKPG